MSRYFHRDIGLTLVAYRTRLRLIRFIQLVEGGDRSFLAAAIDAGFGSYSQCHRAFQHAFDCHPARLLRNGRERRNEGAIRPACLNRANSPTRCEDTADRLCRRVWAGGDMSFCRGHRGFDSRVCRPVRDSRRDRMLGPDELRARFGIWRRRAGGAASGR